MAASSGCLQSASAFATARRVSSMPAQRTGSGGNGSGRRGPPPPRGCPGSPPARRASAPPRPNPAVPPGEQPFDEGRLAVVVAVADRATQRAVGVDLLFEQLQPPVHGLRIGLRRPLELFADDEIETLQRVAEAADALAGGWLDVKQDPERHEAGQVLGPAEVVSAGDSDNIA